MTKYVTRPVQVDAWQFTPERREEIKQMLILAGNRVIDCANDELMVQMITGTYGLRYGDWVVRGLGRLRLVSGKDFPALYEKVPVNPAESYRGIV